MGNSATGTVLVHFPVVGFDLVCINSEHKQERHEICEIIVVNIIIIIFIIIILITGKNPTYA